MENGVPYQQLLREALRTYLAGRGHPFTYLTTGERPTFKAEKQMNETARNTHPFSLEVGPAPQSADQYTWTIRKLGKVHQRADRRFPTKSKAEADGFKTIEKLLHGGDDRF